MDVLEFFLGGNKLRCVTVNYSSTVTEYVKQHRMVLQLELNNEIQEFFSNWSQQMCFTKDDFAWCNVLNGGTSERYQ